MGYDNEHISTRSEAHICIEDERKGFGAESRLCVSLHRQVVVRWKGNSISLAFIIRYLRKMKWNLRAYEFSMRSLSSTLKSSCCNDSLTSPTTKIRWRFSHWLEVWGWSFKSFGDLDQCVVDLDDGFHLSSTPRLGKTNLLYFYLFRELLDTEGLYVTELHVERGLVYGKVTFPQIIGTACIYQIFKGSPPAKSTKPFSSSRGLLR